jgi:hypothetical protein
MIDLLPFFSLCFPSGKSRRIFYPLCSCFALRKRRNVKGLIIQDLRKKGSRQKAHSSLTHFNKPNFLS